MEDRYLFKAKFDDSGRWVKGQLVEVNDTYLIIPNHAIKILAGWFSTSNIIEVKKDTICQCTGLKDRNGKLIWENDIVNCLTEECCGYIGWNESEAGFYFNVLLEDGRFEEEHIYDYQDGIEVIGNIFDNPELLESEK